MPVTEATQAEFWSVRIEVGEQETVTEVMVGRVVVCWPPPPPQPIDRAEIEIATPAMIDGT